MRNVLEALPDHLLASDLPSEFSQCLSRVPHHLLTHAAWDLKGIHSFNTYFSCHRCEPGLGTEGQKGIDIWSLDPDLVESTVW